MEGRPVHDERRNRGSARVECTHGLVRLRCRGEAFLALGAVAAALLAGPSSASAASSQFAPCGPNGLVCATLNVPVDYPGATLGQIPLYVEQLPAAGTPRGVMFLLAGGPGQASAETFDLGRKAAYWRSFFPGYTLVAYDDRGTGKSGALACPTARTVGECGTAIASRAYYTTRDHAEDIESVRLALGVDIASRSSASRTGRSTRRPTRSRIRRPCRAAAARLGGPAGATTRSDRVAPDDHAVGRRHLHLQRRARASRPGRERGSARSRTAPGQPAQRDRSFRPDARPVPDDDRRRHALSLAYESDLSSASRPSCPLRSTPRLPATTCPA